MPDPLPGMPPRIGDRGLFVCGPDDIAPWERPTRARRTSNDVPRPPRRPAVWLVLAACPDCILRTGRYCQNHNASNWWLTTMASAPNGGKRKSARPES